ncbi:THAP domain-containing protein 3-like [Pseudomyrmex gracilis]|uniref:THAP domain-containing protein 3-like n=1 Tax=Pseudomyrmex gracilis TaxID=219809 RepID=UPI000995A54B|nr:THAP domain-containing protein 3-like [Pseudomyrmex gracilis]
MFIYYTMVNTPCLICRKYQKDHTHLSFHNFPKCEKLKKVWLERLNLINFEPKQNDLICSDHFKKSCIIPGKRRRLISGSIPYINKEEIEEEIEFAVSNNATKPAGNCVDDDVSEPAVNNDATAAILINNDTMKSLVIYRTNNLPPIVTERFNIHKMVAATTNECHSKSSPTNREVVVANVERDHTYCVPLIVDHKRELERTKEIVKELKSSNALLKRKLRRAKQTIHTLLDMIPKTSFAERKETSKVFCEL